MKALPIGGMFETVRGDRFVIERYEPAWNVICVRWVRGGEGSSEMDPAVLRHCTQIEDAPLGEQLLVHIDNDPGDEQ